MADIGALVVRITADASSLAAELQKIGEGGNKAAAATQRAGKIMAGAFLAAASAVTYMTIQAGKQAEELEQLSQITGIHTDALQGYEVAMNRVGLSGQDMTIMMKTLSKNMEEARTGTGEAADRFRQLGIDITKVTSTDEAIRRIFNSVSRFKDGAEKAAVVGALLGKSGLAWIPAMKDGAKALDEAAEKAKKMGQLSQDQIAALTSMDDALDDLGMAWKFFAGNLGSIVAPAIQYITELFTAMLSWASQALKELREFLGMTGQIEASGGAKSSVPKLVDSSKQQANARSLMDAKFKANEGTFASAKAMADADLALTEAQQAQKLALFQRTELEIAKHKQQVVEASTQWAIQNAELELDNYKNYSEQKLATFARDEKSLAERNKFEAEAIGRIKQLETDLAVARTKATTQRIQAATAVGVAIQNEEVKALQDEVTRYEALDAVQQQTFKQETFFLGNTEAMRRVRLGLIESQADLEKKVAQQRIKDERELAQEMENIDNRTRARRLAVAEEFPTFWEKQLNDLQASNVFSMGMMVSTWSNAIATMIVKGGDLKAAWEATKIAIIQGFINMAVSAAATAAKTLIVNEVAAGGVAGVWAGAASFVVGVWATVSSAMTAIFAALVGIVTAVGTAIMTVLSAIAAALSATVFGIPYAGAILVGVGLIAAALIALKAVKFAEGGIVTGPTLGLVGEAGPEVIIPLDRMGDMMGGSEKPINVTLAIDGKKFMKATARYTATAWRAEGAGA